MAAPPPPAPALSGAFIGTVLESRHPGFASGDRVRGGHLWQTHHVVPGMALAKIPEHADPSDELGILGGPGLVAWCGMRVGKVRPGETLVVSAAGGAIGMLAGQLGKAAGARVVGVASGEKAEFVVREIGFDACIDRTVVPVAAELDRHCPDGIDVYFDHVGGDVGAAAFDRLREYGRYVVCGMAAEYNGAESTVGPPLRPVLRKRLRIEGFVVYDHYDDIDLFRAEVQELRRQGAVKYRYETLYGLHSAPQGLIRLLSGHNRGKVIVDLTAEV
jgi:NADPH-dependent curcumin reductase CurA